MKTLRLLLIVLFPLVLIYLLYTVIRDMIFPEIGIYKTNMSSFKTFCSYWRSNNSTASIDDFPMQEALLRILKSRYPYWGPEQCESFLVTNRVHSINELIFEIAKTELPPNLFQRYKERYGERIA